MPRWQSAFSKPSRRGACPQGPRFAPLDERVWSVSVYVDHAFAQGEWGRWRGGGHLQADTLAELHEFAGRLGLRREWFQSKPGRPDKDHYDLTEAARERAVRLGAISEDRAAATRRRRAIRAGRHLSVSSAEQ